MVAVTAIQAQINRGDGLAAKILGQPYAFIRPVSALAPLGTPYITLPVFLTVDEKSATTRANQYGKPVWYARFDRTQSRVGDYIVGSQSTFFIAAQQSLLTTLAVECNAVVSFARSTGDSEQPGHLDENDYSGRLAASDTPLLTSWPASVLIKTRGEGGSQDLPGAPKQALFEVLLPNAVGVALQIGDLMADDRGNGYVLSAVEATDLGYRLYAQTRNP